MVTIRCLIHWFSSFFMLISAISVQKLKVFFNV